MSNAVRVFGRPTKYNPQYCEQLIEHMAQGYSFESFAAVVGTCKQTIYSWCEQNPEFLDAKNQGFAISRYFWEKIGLAGMSGKLPGFNGTVWSLNMKNRFGWTEKREETSKVEHTHKLGQPSLEDLKKALEKDNVIHIEEKKETT